MAVFGKVSLYQDTTVAGQNPTVNDDIGKGYNIGSRWFNSTTGQVWTCLSDTVGAAVWTTGTLLAALIGANMNVTTDQPFTPHALLTGGKFSVTAIKATNASLSLTTAAGGIYPAAAKGGSALVAAGQVYTALSSASALLSLTLAAGATGVALSVVPILSLTTPQGAAATADFYMFGEMLPTGVGV